MTTLQGQKTGFIGLGLMGKPMARNLANAGADLIVHNRSSASVDELVSEGMAAGGSPSGTAQGADIIIMMLPDTPTVEKILLGENGVLVGLKPGSLVIDMGTTKVPVTRAFAKAVEDKGCDYLDAPVSGGTIGAENATLTIMAGGTDAAFKLSLIHI